MLTVLFVVLKVFSRRGYVKLDNDVAELQRAIEWLKQPKREQQDRIEKKRSEAGPNGSSGIELQGINGPGSESSHDGRTV